MQLNRNLICFVVLFFIVGCNYNQIALNPNSSNLYTINYDDSIPENIINNLNLVFDSTSVKNRESSIQITLSNYRTNEYKIYAGKQLRSLEGEAYSSLILNINGKKKVSKVIKITQRYKSDELNPFAEQEAFKLVQDNINKKIIDEVIFEISLHEM